jgi:hypothetical protein
MTLRSPVLDSGPADYKANLYYLDGKRTATLTTLGFHVYA